MSIEMMMRNMFLQRLHKRLNLQDVDREKKKRVVNLVLDDVSCGGIFKGDSDDNYTPDYFYQIEKTSDVIFSNASQEDKKSAIVQVYRESKDVACLTIEERVERKQAELNIDKHIKKTNFIRLKNKKKPCYTEGRFGRSPLHEAIVMKDIKAIKKYVYEGKYLNYVDNNSHSPLQLARYENYAKAIKILEKESET